MRALFSLVATVALLGCAHMEAPPTEYASRRPARSTMSPRSAGATILSCC